MPLFNPAVAPGVWLPSDQGYLAWNYDGPSAAAGSSAPLGTAGTMYVVAIPVRSAMSVTNVVAVLNTNGSVLTSGQCFAALYAGVGGALVGVSADQSTAWGSGATKLVTIPLASGPFTVAPGIVYAAFWFNGTTGPSFARASTASQITNAGLAATASRWGTANTSVTTTAPGTLGTIAAAGNAYWAALS